MLLFLNVIPMGYSFYLSLTNFDGIGEPRFIGLRNYTGLLKDYRFLDSIVHTLKFSFFNIVATLTASFLLASLLTKKIKGKGVLPGGAVPSLCGTDHRDGFHLEDHPQQGIGVSQHDPGVDQQAISP